MDKYYTPQIEEFHVGFEYEEREFIYTDKGWFTSKEHDFVSKIFRGSDYLESYYLTERINRNLFNDTIRVKYLDREDIESLGFKHTDGAMREDVRQFFELKVKNTHARNLEDDILLIYIRKTNHVLVSTSFGEDLPLEQWFTLFTGKIKNKSELKDLLDKLEIKYETHK